MNGNVHGWNRDGSFEVGSFEVAWSSSSVVGEMIDDDESGGRWASRWSREHVVHFVILNWECLDCLLYVVLGGKTSSRSLSLTTLTVTTVACHFQRI